jgi:hypothetical protein
MVVVEREVFLVKNEITVGGNKDEEEPKQYHCDEERIA